MLISFSMQGLRGKIGLTQDLVCDSVQGADKRTIFHNKLPALFRRAGNPAPAPVRSSAGVLSRWAHVGACRAALWLLAGRLPGAVPRLAAGRPFMGSPPVCPPCAWDASKAFHQAA